MRILGNDSLSGLTGLTNPTIIGHELIIGMDVFGNHALTSLTGLEKLTSVGGDLIIENNNLLTSLMGLDSLTHISGQLIISGNVNLTSLNGLNHLDANTISHLIVNWNSSLSDCAIQSICEYLLSLSGSAYFIGNAAGCNSRIEVEEACGVGVDESVVSGRRSAVSIYPNPSSTTITVEMLESSHKFQLSIFNLNGQEAMNLEVAESFAKVDISHLSRGMYFVRVLYDDNKVQVGKFVRK